MSVNIKRIPPLFFIFLFFFLLIFIVFRDLFYSYFEADEWFHFTHYFPLINNPYGFLIAPIKSVTDAIALSAGQHVVPLGEEMFFLSTKFFGLNFFWYVFMSLLLHATNCFLVFVLIQELLYATKQNVFAKYLFAFIGGIFFALSAVPMQAVTWAAFYGQNVLSVTFFLLCLVFLKKGFRTKRKKYIVFSLVFFILDLLTKETAIALILIIPFVFLLEPRTFSWKFLGKIFLAPLIIFLPFRFLLPVAYVWFDKSVHFSQLQIPTTPADLSVLFYRLINFPFNMISEVFFSRQTILALMQLITPVLYLQYTGEPQSRYQNRMFFLYGPGNEFLVYLFAIVISVITFFIIKRFYQTKKKTEAHAVLIGAFIILACSLPLAGIMLSVPVWGTDFFDSRHYYMPSVGAAILFPFLLFSIASFINKSLHFIRLTIPTGVIVFVLFLGWLLNNMTVFQETMNNSVKVLGNPRREVVKQLKEYLPKLPQKAVIHFETDGGGPFGPVLPFQTSIPQVLSVVYYDNNHLPDSFYDKFIFNMKPEGYQQDKGRGFGYYASKKTLSDALIRKQFSVNNLYSFYYDSKSLKVSDRTKSVRNEMRKYLVEREKMGDWNSFHDASSAAKIQFNYPSESQVSYSPIATTEAKLVKSLELDYPKASLNVIKVTSTFDPTEMVGIAKPVLKTVAFDTYHQHEVFIVNNAAQTVYLMKVDELLLVATTDVSDKDSLAVLEKLLGSVTLIP